MSAADFLLSPAVQKLMQVLYAAPDQLFSASELAQRTKQERSEVDAIVEHLVRSGLLAKQQTSADQPETVKVDRSFVFHRELRSIALKSFAAAEPIRHMLRSKFKNAVVRAFVLGEHDDNTIEILVVHGAVMPDEASMAAACKKLSKSLHRHLQVHVISSDRLDGLTSRDALAIRLAAASAFEIIAPGDTKAVLPTQRPGLLQSAKKKLASLGFSAPQRSGSR
ncbi:MarR family transcriptional regulator [Variovorax boronicumulans]|uniref:MarR family transcriptional regulator n=1 Tax=Variovorax boronicumulans TaxID=436515 RepID=UPI001C59A1A2